MDINYLTIDSINPDKHLSVAIATTFAASVSHIHSGQVLNGCLVKPLQWRNYSEDELLENSDLAWRVAPFDTYAVEAANAVVEATYAAYSSKATSTARYATYASRHASSARYTVNAARSDTYDADNGKGKFIQDTLKALLPLIMKYKINNSKRPFESPDEILDLLEDRDKQQFLFNLDLLT